MRGCRIGSFRQSSPATVVGSEDRVLRNQLLGARLLRCALLVNKAFAVYTYQMLLKGVMARTAAQYAPFLAHAVPHARALHPQMQKG